MTEGKWIEPPKARDGRARPSRFCTFDERVRIELAPQVLTFDASDETLDDTVTYAHYRPGGRDALGRLIMPEEAEDRAARLAKAFSAAGFDREAKQQASEARRLREEMIKDRRRGAAFVDRGQPMRCVDWRSKHKPWIWKIYEWKDLGKQRIIVDPETLERRVEPKFGFVNVAEIAAKDQAFEFARTLALGGQPHPTAMVYINDEVRDQGLDYADTNGTRMDICSQEPTSYSEATTDGTYSLGNETAMNTGATEDNTDTDGRKVVVPAITDGDVTETDTATHWGLTDASSVLIAAGALSSSQVVTDTNKFTLDAVSITIRDAA